MSDYKEIEMSIEITKKHCLMDAIEAVLRGALPADATDEEMRQMTVAQNQPISNKWGHPTKVDVFIRQSQLPADLRGFGDMGFRVGSNGKFVFVGCSAEDAANPSYGIDRSLGLKEGEFMQRQSNFIKQVEQAYGAFDMMEQIEQNLPGGVFGTGNPNAVLEKNEGGGFKSRFQISTDNLAKSGIHVYR